MKEEVIEKRLDIISSKLNALIKEAKKPVSDKITWVKAPVITSLTGWDHQGMRKARINGYVTFKKDDKDCFWYSLESINPIFFKSK